MSLLTRSPGIVLKSRPFRESSKIVTVLSREEGKIDLLAHGARKPGSRFGAALEPGTEAEFIYYQREGKNLWTLSDADIIRSYQWLRENPANLHILARILRLLFFVSHPGEGNSNLYNLCLSILNALEKSEYPDTVYHLFLWKTAILSGFTPHLEEKCMMCGRDEDLAFSIFQGGFLCKEHSQGESGMFRFNKTEQLLLAGLSDMVPTEISTPFPSIVVKMVVDYSRYHLHTDSSIIK